MSAATVVSTAAPAIVIAMGGGSNGSGDFSFRHFREIGSNWKYQRTSRVPFDPSIHRTDDLLRTTLKRVSWKA